MNDQEKLFRKLEKLKIHALDQKTIDDLFRVHQKTGKLNSSQVKFLQRKAKQYQTKKSKQLKLIQSKNDFKLVRKKDHYHLIVYYEGDDYDEAIEKAEKEHFHIKSKIQNIIAIPKTLKRQI
jgi:hypothetical protein